MSSGGIDSLGNQMTRALLLLASLAILTGCSSQTNRLVWPEMATETFRAQYQVKDVNSSITLWPVGADDITFTRGEAIVLELRNTSQNLLAFSNDFGVVGMIYSSELESWIEVPSEFIYSPRGRLLGSLESEIPNVAPVDFLPNEPAVSGHDQLRIIVRGNILVGEGEIGEPVLAFLDVKLE